MHLFTQKVILIDDIFIPGGNRDDFGDIRGLSTAMDDIGLIQPIAVKQLVDPALPQPEKPYMLLAGERRIKALRLRGEKEVPASVFPHTISDRFCKQIKLYENVARLNLSPAEQDKHIADFHRAMQEEHGTAQARDNAADGVEPWRLADTAEYMGVSAAKVHSAIQIADAVDIAEELRAKGHEGIPDLKNAKSRQEITRTVNKIIKEAMKSEAAAKHAATLPTDIKSLQDRLISSYIISDFFALAPKIGSGTVSFIEADPPYGIGLDKTKDSNTYVEVPEDKYTEFINKLVTTCWRIAAPDAFLILWHDPYWEGMIASELKDAGWRIKRTKGIWVKDESSNQATDWNLSQNYEQFYVAVKGSPRLMKPARNAIFDFPCVPTHLKYHETERPIALIEELIDTFCPPDGRIVVPFLGSAKTLLAAANKKRTAIGCDLATNYKEVFTRMVQEQPWGMFHDNE